MDPAAIEKNPWCIQVDEPEDHGQIGGLPSTPVRHLLSRRKFCKREEKTLRVFPIFVDSRIQKTAIASKLPNRQTAVQKMSQQLLLSILSRLIWCEGNPDKRKEQMQVAP